MANQIDLVNLGIYLFVGLALVGVSLLAFFLSLGIIDLFQMTIALIFISLLELVATLGLWMYSGHIATKSAPALTMLGEVARRAELVLALSTPLFDFLEELSYRFQWSPDARRAFLEDKIEELREKLEKVAPPEPRPENSGIWASLVRTLSGLPGILSGRGKEAVRNPGSSEGPIRINRWRGRKLE